VKGSVVDEARSKTWEPHVMEREGQKANTKGMNEEEGTGGGTTLGHHLPPWPPPPPRVRVLGRPTHPFLLGLGQPPSWVAQC
jgi:hypothetical protein